ncbi:hypothetical protein WA026_000429 [Henosepilachna vigintioctopunctata]|uniref:ZAD domain-containing protein n=1 Tax=Henosepilachna vigintioctopunctata TaxID=420089 RepID=A0AAW1V0F6_9CUCU
MNEQINKDCCYLCDTYLTSIPNKVQIEPKRNAVERISTVKKYLPTINKWQFDLICESCLNYILDFDEIRGKWENNESIFKQKTQDRSKGLSDISNSKKKKCTYICRLCLNAINAQEVTFVYHDDQVYESSYVHKMLSLHSPHTDLSLTENPVICNECLDEIQTFDAFYQMWMEVQDSKVQCSDRNVNLCDGDVQLRSSDDNTESRTRCNLTEEESIGSTLSNAENLLSDRFDFTNGISTGKSSNDDIFLISDDEDTENQISNSAKIEVDTFTEAESAVRGLLNNEDSVSGGTREEFQNDVCSVSDDEDIIEQSLDVNQNSTPISGDCNLAQIIPVKENVPPGICNDDVTETILSESDGLFYRNECDALHSSFKVDENSDINSDECRIRLWTSNEEHLLIPDNEFSLENISGSSMPVQEKFAFVEIDDSESQDSDDCEEISTPLLPKISKVCSVNENEISMNDTKIEENESHQYFASNTDFSNESAAVITPSIEINMTKVKELFQHSPGGTIVVLDDENEFEMSPQDVPRLEINMSKVKELFQDENKDFFIEDNKESNLEENLSDFLQFNKSTNLKRNIDISNELLDFEHQLELDDAHVKKFKVEENSTSPPKDKYTFLSAFKDFVVTKEKEPEQSSSSKKSSKKSAGTLDVTVSNDDNSECYCKWYPYEQRSSNKSKSRKKIKAIVMENPMGSQIYQCNKCLLSVDKECDLLSHNCIKSKVKERFSCTRRRCHFSSQEEENFVLHSIFHNVEDLGWLKCTICEFRTLDDHFMAEHHKQSHQMGIVQKHSKCSFCYFEADDPLILKHHIKRRHRANVTYLKSKMNKKVEAPR